MFNYKQLEVNDCWRTCIAYILNLDPKTVPHFYNIDKEGAVDFAQAWLKMRGYSLIKLALPGETSLADVMQVGFTITGGEFPYILSGKTPRGMDHAVVVNSMTIELDPFTGERPVKGQKVFKGPMTGNIWGLEIIVGLLR